MKISGNSNANLFFKRHGVSELQMKSEKKYNTKAATEYKKHLQRALLDNMGATISRKDSVDSNDEKDNSVEWGADAGLDNLIKSVSGEDLNQKAGAESAAPASVFMSAAAAPAPAQAPAAPAPAPAPAVVLKKTPVAADIGSISVALGDASISSSTASKGPIKVGTLGKGPKKSIAKKIGARKLTPSGGSDGALESFEKVEERTEAVTQEVEDHKLAVKLQNSENLLQGSGSSRLAAVYADAESIYTAPTTQSSSSSSSSFSSQGGASYSNSNNNYNSGMGYNGGNGNGGGASNNRTATYGHLDKGDAQERFGKAKSISSDSYWGNNKTDEREMQGRLNQYRGASEISSDMLNGTEDSRDRADSDDGLSALKDSVKDFFSQIG